jgi:hypothetical protein
LSIFGKNILKMTKNYSLKCIALLCVVLLNLTVFASGSLTPKGNNGLKANISKSLKPLIVNPNLELAPGVLPGGAHTPSPNRALWDIQFDYDIYTPSNAAALVSVVWTGTEFWSTQWSVADSVYQFDINGNNTGRFKVTGMGAVRSLTIKGDTVYAGINTTTIRRIKVSTKALLTGIVVPGLTTGGTAGARWVTYCPTANSGAGGLYYGNFASEINLVTTGGTLISSIPAATHTLVGMYGAAYDNLTPGGPYLWAFNQEDPNGGASQAVLVGINPTTGALTGVTHDVDADQGSQGGLAGGVTVAQLPGYTKPTLACINQGLGLIGYELAPVPIAPDVNNQQVYPSNGLSFWPLFQNAPFNVNSKLKNVGTSTATGTVTQSFVLDGANAPIYVNAAAPVNINAGASYLNSAGPVSTVTAEDVYTVGGIASTTGDVITSNDTNATIFVVDASTFGRDYASFGEQVSSVGIGAGATTNGAIGQVYTLVKPARLDTVLFYLSGCSANQPVSASVYSVTGGVPSLTPLASTNIYTTTQLDQDSGVVLTLAISGGPLTLPVGDFMVSVNELGDSVLGLATTANLFTTGKHFVKWSSFNGGNWAKLDTFGAGFMRASVIRPFLKEIVCNLTATATPTNPTCGLSNGKVKTTVTGNVGAVTYLWSTGATTDSIFNRAPGTYTLTITNNGCADTVSVTLTNSGTVPTVTMVNTSATCGGSNGTATANGTPGTYVWNTSPAQTTQTATGLAPGAYSVTVTAGGCSATGSTTITNSGVAPTVSVVTAPSTCGGATGSATANGTAGTYVWSTSPAQTTQTATGLAAGSYTVTVTAAGCSASASGVVTNPGAPSVTVSAVNPTCAGKSDGTATASATGGTGAYTYTWSTSPAQTTATATGLAAGTYNVTVLATGCAGIGSVTVTAPAALAVSASASTQPTCSYSANGAATATATGGTGTLTYTWSNGTSGASLSNGANGTVKVYVVDTKGCKDSASVVFNTPAVTASASSTAVKCFGGNDGTATVTAAGGTGVLNYAWSSTPTQTTITATGLASGPYSVTVKDANMCSATASTSVSQPATALSATTTTTATSATVSAVGGTNPYTYTWSTTPVQTAATATGLTPGSYSVTVKDANNCTVSKTVVISSIIDAEAAGFSLVRVYPNPSNGAFTLNIEMNDASTVSIAIMDIAGKVVYNDNLGVVSKLTKTINIQGMAAGVYTIRYATEKGIATQKLIIE